MGEKENVCVYLYVLLCVLLEDTMSKHKNKSDCFWGARITFRLRVRQKTSFYHKNCVLCCSVVSDSLGLHVL